MKCGLPVSVDHRDRALKPERRQTMRECYDNDCEELCGYLDSDLYEYFDAALGNIVAFTCKKCGLTNMV